MCRTGTGRLHFPVLSSSSSHSYEVVHGHFCKDWIASGKLSKKQEQLRIRCRRFPPVLRSWQVFDCLPNAFTHCCFSATPNIHRLIRPKAPRTCSSLWLTLLWVRLIDSEKRRICTKSMHPYCREHTLRSLILQKWISPTLMQLTLSLDNNKSGILIIPAIFTMSWIPVLSVLGIVPVSLCMLYCWFSQHVYRE